MLAEKEIDCAVIGPTTNMEYLLGGTPHADERLSLLAVRPDKVQMIAPELNAEAIRRFTDMEMVTWADADGPGSALSNSLLSAGKLTSLAVDGSMRADFLVPLIDMYHPERIISADPNVSSVDCSTESRSPMIRSGSIP